MNTAGFVQFVRGMDECWLRGRLEDLRMYLAEDVVVVAPGGQFRVTGSDAAIESYRQFTSSAEVKVFETDSYFVTERSQTAIVEYEWTMIWVAASVEHNDKGREVLVLANLDGSWRVVWRTQIPGG